MFKDKFTYLNGDFIEHLQAKVHVDDRGYIFGDGIYENMAFYNKTFVDALPHYERFVKTCNAVGFLRGGVLPSSFEGFMDLLNSIVQKNSHLGFDHGFLYIQVTRGNLGTRQHNAPKLSKELAILATINKPVEIQDWWFTKGLSCITYQDIRWQRRDIKSLQLLPNILAKQKAIDESCDDAIFIDSSIVTEATAANLFIVKHGKLLTHPKSNKILHGITRERIIKIANSLNIKTEEIFFTEEDMLNSDEVFLTNSNSWVRPVTKINNKLINGGVVGEISKTLSNKYQEFVKQH